MKLAFLLLLSFCFQVQAAAQQIQQGNYADYMMVENRFNKRGSDLEGSPYLSEEWAPGYIIFKNDYKLEKVLMRFNVFTNSLDIDFKNVEYTAKSDDVKEFYYVSPATNKKELFKKMLLKEESAFVQIVWDGKLQCGAVHKMRRTRGTSSGTGSEVLNPTKDRILLYTEYYLIKEGTATKFSLNKKSFLKSLPNHAAEIEKFLRENDLDIKNENDLIRAGAYYNSLD
jgi:hypothetical protein